MMRMSNRVRKMVTAMLITISALSAGVAVYATSIPDRNIYQETTDVFFMSGKLESVANFSEGSIYGRSGTLEFYPEEITEKIYGTYTFKTDPASSGDYRMTLKATYYIQDGKNRVILWDETLMEESGSYYGYKTVNFSIDIPELKERLERVKEGTGVSRLVQSVTIGFTATSDTRMFDHTVQLNKKNGLYSFLNTEKTQTESTTQKIVDENYIGGVGVDDARVLYASLSISALIPAVAINRDAFSALREKNSKRGTIIVSGKKVGDRVILDSFEDMKKVFQLSDSPVIKSRDMGKNVYTIEVAGVTYEYRD